MEFEEIIIATKLESSLDHFFKDKKYGKIAVLVDENTHKHCYPLINTSIPKHEIIRISPGEENKNIQTCQQIWKALTDFQFDRNGLLINLGGGVIGDMGGFCAATYKRGIDFVNIPTTLLSQVDASVGGKLGIDFQDFKNHIGLFKSPVAVIIHESFLKTLPAAELRSGFAEVIKHHLIWDHDRWPQLINTRLNDQNWRKIITHSIEIKKSIVTQDPKESGLRKVLNFGHTIGHAVESFYLNNPGKKLLHGEAIAVGMIAETFLSQKYLNLDDKQASQILDYLIKIFEPGPIDEKEIDTIAMLSLQDKKNQDSLILSSLLASIGDCKFNMEISQTDIRDALLVYNKTLYKHQIERSE